MRINQYLAICGLSSRRKAEEIISSGRVTVNGQVVDKLALQVDGEKDIVRVDGKIIENLSKKIYVLLNKPKGYITTSQDERNRPVVFDLVNIPWRLFSVGRLDRYSEGLILLTNDGELAHRLMHPKYKVWKTYRVKLNSEFNDIDFHVLTSGMELDGRRTSPCDARFYSDSKRHIEVTLREGKNRQLRRMLLALGYEVVGLRRTRIGPLKIKGLARGKWRFLTTGEIQALRAGIEYSWTDRTKKD